MKQINNRYEIIRKLKTDIYGTEYHVLDKLNKDEELRLKVLSLELSESNVVDYFMVHFVHLATYRHKNVLAAHDFDIIEYIDNSTVINKQYFFTMDYFDESKVVLINSLSNEERIEVVKQICYGLSYLHFRGYVYKYLSLNSLIVIRDENGLRVLLNDVATNFEFASQLSSTYSYMEQFFSPEVLRNDKATVESDVYSLGVLIFYIIHKLDPAVLNFREIFNDNSDKEIDRVISVMTFNNPQERYQSIREFIDKFQGIYDFDYTFWDRSYYEKLNFMTPMVGRKKLKNRVFELIENRESRENHIRMVLIEGEAGSGKTRFAKEIIFLNRLLRIKQASVELTSKHKNGFFLFKKILRDIIRQNVISPELIKKYGSEIVKLLPELVGKWKINPSESLLDKRQEELRVINRVFRFLVEFLQFNPMVVVIDNFHFLSDQDFELVDYLVEYKKSLPIIFICTYREDKVDQISDINDWNNIGVLEKYSVNKFNYSEAADMIANIIGVGEKPMELTTEIMSEAIGNPKYIEEVLKNLYMFEYLYVNDSRQWEMKVEYIKELELPLRIDDIATHPLDSFDSESLVVLQAISLFEAPVSFEILDYMLEYNEKQLNSMLDQLESLKLLNKKLGDWGYKYDFYNKRYRKLIFSGMDKETKVNYHKKASEILEIRYSTEGKYQSESLIHHLINSDRLEDASKYAVETANRMEKLNVHKQAVEFYKQALDLMDKLDEKEEIVKLMIKLSEVYLKLNESDAAVIMLDNAMEIAKEQADKRMFVDIRNMKSEIDLTKRNSSNLEENIEENYNLSKEIGYVEGELNAALILCRVYLLYGEINKINRIVDKYIDKVKGFELSYYYGRFSNEKGVYYYKKNMISDAFKCFLNSSSNLERSDKSHEAWRSLNNLGALSLNSLGDIEKSREYYFRAISLIEKKNITWGKDMLYSNISRTYLKEDRHEKALKYLSKAIRIAELSGTYDVLFHIYSNLCITNYETGRYDEAFRYLIKIDYEYKTGIGRSMYEGIYHLNHISYYTRVRDYDSAYRWYDKFVESRVEISENIEFYIRLSKIRLDIFAGNQHEYHKEMLFENLETLVKVSTNAIEIKDVRDLILDVAFEYLLAHKYIEVEKILELDSELIDTFNTDKLAVKRAVLVGVQVEDQVEYYEKLISDIRANSYVTELWISYFLLANGYLEVKEYYPALVHYSNALEILRKVTHLIPEDQRFGYIFNDESKVTLYKKLIQLTNKILNRKNAIDIITDKELPESIEEFFELKDLKKILKNKKFLNSVQETYFKKYKFKFKNLDSLISSFGISEFDNMVLILKYLAQITFADTSVIYIVDDVHNVEETIRGFGEKSPDISRYINMLEDINGGMYVNNQGWNKNGYNDIYESNAVILIPIISRDYLGNHVLDHKRQYDNGEENGKIIGYLYLSSEKVFNNISKETLEICKSLINVIYVMVDNYILKKTSSIDKLTGVYLRKHIEDLFAVELQRAKTNHHELSVVMADIDHFKNVNDTFGHQRGDEILRSIGSIFKESLREGDLIGRYGGEEFIVILPGTGEINGFNVCENIRKKIENSMLLGKDFPLTMSFGISSYPSHGIIEHDLIEKADQALYESKHMGRNKSTIWTSNIGNTMLRFDKLAGILVGNISADTRKVQSMVDVISFVNKETHKEKKIDETLSILLDICEADTVMFMTTDGSNLEEIFIREAGQEEMLFIKDVPRTVIENAYTSSNGECFIDWTNPIYKNESKTPDWLSYITVPLVYNGIKKGLIILSVSISKREFNFDVLNYVSTLSGVISVIMYGDKR